MDVSALKESQDQPTGMAVITVLPHGGQQHPGAAGGQQPSDPAYVQQHLDLLEACDYVVFQLEIPLETVVYAAKEASRLGKKVILDPAPVPGLPEELLQSLYLIKPNETELSILTGRPHDPARLREDALSLQARGVKNVLVTLGGAGSYLLREDGTEARIPADSTVKVVDTTAAGDSYMGALAVALSQGKDLEEAARFASPSVSDIVVSGGGRRPPFPLWRSWKKAPPNRRKERKAPSGLPWGAFCACISKSHGFHMIY